MTKPKVIEYSDYPYVVREIPKLYILVNGKDVLWEEYFYTSRQDAEEAVVSARKQFNSELPELRVERVKLVAIDE